MMHLKVLSFIKNYTQGVIMQNNDSTYNDELGERFQHLASRVKESVRHYGRDQYQLTCDRQ